jgi:hypothetical protein
MTGIRNFVGALFAATALAVVGADTASAATVPSTAPAVAQVNPLDLPYEGWGFLLCSNCKDL